jgi:hypothetical protein
LTAAWGHQAHAAWTGEVRIAGLTVVAHLFCLRLRASGVPFVGLPRPKARSVSRRALSRVHLARWRAAGVCHDSPKTAVVRILARPLRESTFSSLGRTICSSIFCRPVRPTRRAPLGICRLCRRNALVPVLGLPAWEALNAQRGMVRRTTRQGLEQEGDASSLPLRSSSRAPAAGSSQSAESGHGRPQPLLGALRLRGAERPRRGLHRAH